MVDLGIPATADNNSLNPIVALSGAVEEQPHPLAQEQNKETFTSKTTQMILSNQTRRLPCMKER